MRCFYRSWGHLIPIRSTGSAAVTRCEVRWQSWQDLPNQASTLISFLRRSSWINPWSTPRPTAATSFLVLAPLPSNAAWSKRGKAPRLSG